MEIACTGIQQSSRFFFSVVSCDYGQEKQSRWGAFNAFLERSNASFCFLQSLNSRGTHPVLSCRLFLCANPVSGELNSSLCTSEKHKIIQHLKETAQLVRSRENLIEKGNYILQAIGNLTPWQVKVFVVEQSFRDQQV